MEVLLGHDSAKQRTRQQGNRIRCGEGAFVEVVEDQERTENHCIWKTERSKGGRSPREKCSMFHTSVHDEIQKYVTIGDKRLEKDANALA